MTEHFISDRHAMYAGWIVGIAMKQGIVLDPILDADGNYTDRVVVRNAVTGQDLNYPVTVTLIVPPPPDDWTLT